MARDVLLKERRNPIMKTLGASVFLVTACLAVPQQANAADHTTNPHSRATLTLRQDMRKLWSDHVFWTRDYIVAAVAGTPDQQAAADRLIRNQEDIGNAMAAYYGKPAGDKLTGLLKEHILIAVSDKSSESR